MAEPKHSTKYTIVRQHEVRCGDTEDVISGGEFHIIGGAGASPLSASGSTAVLTRAIAVGDGLTGPFPVADALAFDCAARAGDSTGSGLELRNRNFEESAVNGGYATPRTCVPHSSRSRPDIVGEGVAETTVSSDWDCPAGYVVNSMPTG